MKKRKLVASLLTGFLIFTAMPVNGSAATLDEIKSQQQSKEKEMADLDYQINRTLVEVNDKNEELTALQGKITDLESTIKQTGEEITEQKQVVEERVEQAKNRLKSIQTTEVNQNTVLALMESESLTDFFNRAYVLMTLQSAGNEQVDVAKEEADKLLALEEKQKADKTALEKETTAAAQQKEALDKQVAGLQKTMDENQALLNELDKQRATEEKRIADAKAAAEKAAQEKAAAEKAKQEKVVAQQVSKKEKQQAEPAKQETKVAAKEEKETTSSSTPAKKEKPQATEKAKEETDKKESSSSAKTIVVSATGYSTKEAGLSTHTATGIDLTKNPRVIAVDPSVIPLGSKVEIPGYGVAIAGDTGGAIKGNRIDVHFPTVQQAMNWGRKTVTIKILN
ncbi:3D domain-containing protein [Pisciglobus halotolerans]|uniref:Cystine transport system substrate-binding protein n=1 Tax=Pisciglobus halotolerans TaxID=745365 RepID=A0A1I3B0V4_9LACT|nr:3D domain-containing protein [Pisciglobus halotolerans]SFH55947.1 cystine transport system substrate-binding protein [Pisciglobus halotolerans]